MEIGINYVLNVDEVSYINIQIGKYDEGYRAWVVVGNIGTWSNLNIRRNVLEVAMNIKEEIASGRILGWEEGDDWWDAYRNGQRLKLKMGWE